MPSTKSSIPDDTDLEIEKPQCKPGEEDFVKVLKRHKSDDVLQKIIDDKEKSRQRKRRLLLWKATRTLVRHFSRRKGST